MVACPANSERYIRLAIKHKVWAIRTIRDNLSDPREATSDENIAAVFNLLCVEENMFRSKFAAVDKLRCVEPDHDQRLKHLHGLRDMVRMRGGVLGLWDSNTPQSKTLPSFLIRYVRRLPCLLLILLPRQPCSLQGTDTQPCNL